VALAGAIRELLEDPGCAAELGRRGRDFAATLTDREGIVRQLSTTYTELLGRG
jgi:hypothetical protein